MHLRCALQHSPKHYGSQKDTYANSRLFQVALHRDGVAGTQWTTDWEDHIERHGNRQHLPLLGVSDIRAEYPTTGYFY
jgi:hypothetical protein